MKASNKKSAQALAQTRANQENRSISVVWNGGSYYTTTNPQRGHIKISVHQPDKEKADG